jgi:hypothetical protein
MYKVKITFTKPWGEVTMSWLTDADTKYVAIEKVLSYYDFSGVEILMVTTKKIDEPMLIRIQES